MRITLTNICPEPVDRWGENQQQRQSLKEKAREVPLADKELFCPLGCQVNNSLRECLLCHTGTPQRDGESKLVCKLNLAPPIFQSLKLHGTIGQIKPLVKETC